MTNEALLAEKRSELERLALEYRDVHELFNQTGDPTVYEELLQDLNDLVRWAENADLTDETRDELVFNVKLIIKFCHNSMSNESVVRARLAESNTESNDNWPI